MKSLYDQSAADEVKARLQALQPDTAALWGKMNAPQVLAHLSLSVQMCSGEMTPKRSLIGRLIGPLFRSNCFNDKPWSRNSPTAPELVVADARDLDVERSKLVALIDRFQQAGPDGATREPHAFFGKMTPEEWGKGMYKHLDHHLKQFGV